MSNKSSSVFGGYHGRWEFGQNPNQTIMASHKPKEQPIQVPVPDSTVNISASVTEEKDLSVTSSTDIPVESDVLFFGDPDAFQLICKASSKSQGWMKSTKAYQIDGHGCIVQVTTQQGDKVAEALVFVPYVEIVTDEKGNKKLVAIQ